MPSSCRRVVLILFVDRISAAATEAIHHASGLLGRRSLAIHGDAESRRDAGFRHAIDASYVAGSHYAADPRITTVQAMRQRLVAVAIDRRRDI